MTAIALRIDVSHIAGAERALPLLLPLLEELGCSATFFFSLGADRSGKLWRDCWQKRKALGWASLAYGRFWPAPRMASRCATVIRQVRASGFECGVMPASRVAWLALLQGRYVPETAFEAEILDAVASYRQLFEEMPLSFAAPGNRMNQMAYRLLQRHGFFCVSAAEGANPFWPVANAELVQCLALPVSLPSFDALLASAQQREALLVQSASWLADDYALLSIEDVVLLQPGAIECLRGILQAWLAQGHRVCGLQALAEHWVITRVEHHAIVWSQSDASDRQGPAFP